MDIDKIPESIEIYFFVNITHTTRRDVAHQSSVQASETNVSLLHTFDKLFSSSRSYEHAYEQHRFGNLFVCVLCVKNDSGC